MPLDYSSVLKNFDGSIPTGVCALARFLVRQFHGIFYGFHGSESESWGIHARFLSSCDFLLGSFR